MQRLLVVSLSILLGASAAWAGTISTDFAPAAAAVLGGAGVLWLLVYLVIAGLVVYGLVQLASQNWGWGIGALVVSVIAIVIVFRVIGPLADGAIARAATPAEIEATRGPR